MYPPPFDYAAPSSLDETLALLSEHGDGAKIIAGGQSLIPVLKIRFAQPGILVDLNRVPGLDGIRDTEEGLRIGALVRHNDLAASDVVRERYPAIAAAAPLVADPLVRNLGTLAGSLAHADPAGDWGSVMLALGASVVVRGPSGERVQPIDDFLVSTFTTTLEPTEVLTEVRVPRPSGPAGGTYLKLERKIGDFATVGVAVQLELDDGRIRRAGIGMTAVGSINVRAREAEDALAGREPTPEAFAEAARLAADAARPSSDHRGSADYKRQVVRTFTRRGLEAALQMARSS
jgi:aerobic carbon-monoxide dehydrogenase medium subunit